MDASDHIALWSAVVAFGLGIVSFIVSLRANQISAAAEKLAKAAYLSERHVGVTSRLESGKNAVAHLELAPTGSDQTINSVTLFFPSKFHLRPVALSAGNLRLSVLGLSAPLATYWDSRTPPKEGFGQVRRNVPIPVAVLVHGQSKGDVTLTLGIYDLYCQYVRVENSPGEVELLGLTLNNWCLPETDPQSEADRVMASYEAFSGTSD